MEYVADAPTTAKAVGPLTTASKSAHDSPAALADVVRRHLRAVFLQRWRLALLHVFLPWALWLQLNAASDEDRAVLFLTSLLALVPQVERLGWATEQLVLHIGEAASGVFNVFFLSFPELVVAVVAVCKDESRIARDSLIGGVLSSLMLVNGVALFAGGLQTKVQSFNTALTGQLCVCLIVSALIMCVVSVVPEEEATVVDQDSARPHSPPPASPGEGMAALSSGKHGGSSNKPHRPTLFTIFSHPTADLSHAAACLCVCYYVAVLVFSLHTHREFFFRASDAVRPPAKRAEGDKLEAAVADADADDDEQAASSQEADVLGLPGSVFWCCILASLIAVVSSGLVDSIHGTATTSGLSALFITAILLPTISNLPELAVTLRLGGKGMIDATLAITLGSAAHLALFCLPMILLVDWARGGRMSLDLPAVEYLGYTVGILFGSVALAPGRSTWMLGFSLCIIYLVIAAAWVSEPPVNDPKFQNGSVGVKWLGDHTTTDENGFERGGDHAKKPSHVDDPGGYRRLGLARQDAEAPHRFDSADRVAEALHRFGSAPGSASALQQDEAELLTLQPVHL